MSDERVYVKWSEVGNPKLPGIYRTPDRKIIQISVVLIQEKEGRDGEQSVEIVRNNIAGHNVWIGIRFVDGGADEPSQ